MMRRALRHTVLWIGCGCGAVATATAGSLSVNPVRVSLSSGRMSEALVIRNTGDEPAVVQIELQSWKQDDARDLYSPTRDVLATPPIFTVAPGGSQIVRVGARRQPDAATELDYRLFLQEVPPPPKPGFQGLRMALRVSIPVFVSGDAQSARLRWSARSEPGGKLAIVASNKGNAHVQVANFSLSQGKSALTGKRQVATYVLPSHSREWVVKPDRPVEASMPLHLSAETDSGPLEADVSIATH